MSVLGDYESHPFPQISFISACRLPAEVSFNGNACRSGLVAADVSMFFFFFFMFVLLSLLALPQKQNEDLRNVFFFFLLQSPYFTHSHDNRAR